MFEKLKGKARATMQPDSFLYNTLALVYGYLARKPAVRRAAYMHIFKDSRFGESELWMASSQPKVLLDAVLERWKPRNVLDVGCGTGWTVQYVASKGIECVGLEGSSAAIAASPVKQVIRLVNLNQPVNLGRRFDMVWSYEVAEHIHPAYTDTFIDTLIRHGDLIVMSAARPGQGGAGHFNEQPPSYWIDRMHHRGFHYDVEFSEYLHDLPAEWARNMLVFARSPASRVEESFREGGREGSDRRSSSTLI
jgi:SAM-dependent methyltransferase